MAASWQIAPLGDALKPSKRSAHVMCNRYPGSVASPRALLVHGGEAEDGSSCGDVWLLDLDQLAAGICGSTMCSPWRHIATEGSRGPRSNHAALVHDDKLYVFGGIRARREALAQLEVLDLEALRWELLADAEAAPPPRWNPTLVLVESASCLVCFGGYDGTRKHNDVVCYDLGAQQFVYPEVESASAPPAMTDHAAAVVCDSMVVVGGTHTVMAHEGCVSSGDSPSVHAADSTAHVWTLRLSPLPARAVWTRLACSGAAPASCTSHTATAVGSLLLVSGGQYGWQMAPLTCHVFHLHSASWTLLGEPAPHLRICRHAAVYADGCLMLFGGHDGEALSDDLRRIPLDGLLRDAAAAAATPSGARAVLPAATMPSDGLTALPAAPPSPAPKAAPSAASVGLTAHDMFQVSQKPLRAADLPAALIDGKSDRQLVRVLHTEAVARQLDMYIDPLSGYPAFTKLYLGRRECCGNKCRHCPHGHKNVVRRDTAAPAARSGGTVDLEW